jgi:hypothetical protein
VSMPVPGSRAGPATWCMENGDAIELTMFYGVVAIQGELNKNRLANHTGLDMCVRCSLPTEVRFPLPGSLQFIHPPHVLSSLGQCKMVSRIETYPKGAKNLSHLDGYYSVTPVPHSRHKHSQSWGDQDAQFSRDDRHIHGETRISRLSVGASCFYENCVSL